MTYPRAPCCLNSRLLGCVTIGYLGECKRKWKLLYFNKVYIGVIWVVVKIVVLFLGPYYDTAPNI